MSTMDEREKLHTLASNIVQSQGNRFIKELLRSKDIQIGKNKADFDRHMRAAIDDGKLRLVDVEEWLNRVEGWGEQHVYLFKLPPAISSTLTEKAMYQKAVEGRMKGLWNKSTAMTFDSEDRLASVSCIDSTLRLVWQKAAISWPPVPEMNYPHQDGEDEYEFRAYRKHEDRTITRFEARADLGVAALFIAEPFQSKEHETLMEIAWRAVAAFIDISLLKKHPIDLSRVSMKIDQISGTTDDSNTAPVKVHKSSLFAGGGYVIFGANSKEGSYHDEHPLQELRRALGEEQLKLFSGGEGSFWFERGVGTEELSRRLRVQLYKKGNRIKLWGQMEAKEAWAVLRMLAAYE